MFYRAASHRSLGSGFILEILPIAHSAELAQRRL
jgi:hypothetical protein